MKMYPVTIAAGMVFATFTMFTGMAAAHHSLAMYDQDHPMEVTGTVREFRYKSPHVFIIIEIKERMVTASCGPWMAPVRARSTEKAGMPGRSSPATSCA
jgi:hypothetical protein